MRFWLLFSLLICTRPAFAISTWSFGTALRAGNAGVSLQTKPRYTSGIHATYLFVGNRQPLISLDYQKFTSRLFDFPLRAYAGVGAEAALASEDKQNEEYAMRLPAGGQYEFRATSLQAFSEVVALVGPLPQMQTRGIFTLGVRSWF